MTNLTSNISSIRARFQFFVEAATTRTFERRYYARLDQHTLRLPPFQFQVLCQIAHLANLKTHLLNIARRRRLWRSSRTKRTVNRALGELDRRGLIQRHYSTLVEHRRNRQAKPINLHILQLVNSPETAIFAKVLMYLAFTRSTADSTTVDRLAARIGLDRTIACALLGVIRDRELSTKAIRRAVFRSTRRAWWAYVDPDGNRHSRQPDGPQDELPLNGGGRSCDGPPAEGRIMGDCLGGHQAELTHSPPRAGHEQNEGPRPGGPGQTRPLPAGCSCVPAKQRDARSGDGRPQRIGDIIRRDAADRNRVTKIPPNGGVCVRDDIEAKAQAALEKIGDVDGKTVGEVLMATLPEKLRKFVRFGSDI